MIITEQDIEDLKKELIRASSEEFSNDTKPTWEELKKAAQNFLIQIQKLEILSEQNRLNELRAIVNNPEAASNIINLGRSGKLIYERSKYLLAFDFDEKIKRFREEVPSKMIYVYEDSDGNLQSIELSTREMVEHITSRQRILPNSFKLMAEESERIKEKQLQDQKLQEHLNYVRFAYTGVKNRLGEFFKRRLDQSQQKQGGILLWKVSTKWTLARVTNIGDLKEAYVAALLAKHESDMDKLCGIGPGDAPFYDHYLVQNFFENYIYNVTNKAAILEEDVVGEDTQWGVKSGKAGAPSFEQYRRAALTIINLPNGFSIKDLQEALEEEFPQDVHRNIMSTLGQKEEEKLLQNLKEQTGLTKSQFIRKSYS